VNLLELQSRVNVLLEGVEHPRIGAALALAEECGEVMQWVMEREMYGGSPTSKLEGEVGDVLIALAEVAQRYGVSLERAAEGAVAKLEEKVPGWREALGEELAKVRERMDGP